MRRLAALGMLALATGCSREIVPAPPSADATTSRATAPRELTAEVADAAAPGQSAPKVVLASADADAISLVRTKRLEAKAEGRTLVVYAGAGWCPPCKRFREELAAGKLDATLGTVTLLVFDADADADRLAAAGYSFQHIPYVALPAADGRPLDTVEAAGKGPDAWRALLGKLDGWQQRRP